MSITRWDDLADFSGVQDTKKSIEELDKAIVDLVKTTRSLGGFAQEIEKLGGVAKGVANEAKNLDVAVAKDRDRLSELSSEITEVAKKQGDLKAAQEAQLKTLSSLNKERKNFKEQLKEERQVLNSVNLETEEGRKIAERAAKNIKQLKSETEQLTRASRGANSTLTAAKGSYDALSLETQQLTRRLRGLEGGIDGVTKEAKELQAQIDQNNRKLKEFDASIGQNFRNVGNYQSALKGVAGGLKNLGSALGVAGGVFLLAQAFRDSINIVANFEKQTSILAGVLNKTTDEISELTADATRLGSVTAKTAIEVSQLQEAYARLGFTQSEILNLTEATISGSIALNAELDETSELTGAVVKSFDDFSSVDAPEILDQLTRATQLSALNFAKLQTAIPIVAGAANAAGVPFTKLLSLLGKLSDAGIDASSSSTALRNIFIESAAQGLSYEEILQKIANSTDKLTASNNEFGKRAAVSSTILSQNISQISEFDEELQKAGGTADRVAAQNLDNFAGSLTLLRSAWEGLVLSIEEGSGVVGGAARGLVDFATRALQGLTNLQLIIKQVTGGLESLSDQQFQVFIDVGVTSDGEKVKDILEPVLSITSLNEFKDRSKELRESLVEAFVASGESADESGKVVDRAFKLTELRLFNAAEAARLFKIAQDNNIETWEEFQALEPERLISDIADETVVLSQAQDLFNKSTQKTKEATQEAIELAKKRNSELEKTLKLLGEINGIEIDLNEVFKEASEGIDFNNLLPEDQRFDPLVDEFLKFDEDADKDFLEGIKSAGEKAKEFRKKQREDEKEAEQDHQDVLTAIRRESFALASSIADTVFQGQIARLDAELSATEARFDEEVRLAGDNERAIARIEKRRAAEVSKIRTEQARKEKQGAIFQSIINTASAVVEALPNFILAGIVGAFGAAQTALIAAQPIPQFEKGGTMKKKGLAIFNEKGSELIKRPNKPFEIHETGGAAMGHFEAGTKFIDADKTQQILARQALLNSERSDVKAQLFNLDTSNIESEIKGLRKDLKNKSSNVTVTVSEHMVRIRRNGSVMNYYTTRGGIKLRI